MPPKKRELFNFFTSSSGRGFNGIQKDYTPEEFKEQAKHWLNEANGFYTKGQGFGS